MSLGCFGNSTDDLDTAVVDDEKVIPLDLEEPSNKPKLPKGAIRPQFVNVAAELGIQFDHFSDEVIGRYFLPEVMGSGIAWLDVDCDGRLDVYLGNGSTLAADAAPSDQLNRLFLNRGEAGFEEVSELAGVADKGYAQGLAIGDFDADGFADIFVANYGPNVLLRNNGDGTFQDVTNQAGMEDESWGTSAVWFDIDNDRDLDLYVVNYLKVDWETHQVCTFVGKPGYCGPGKYEGVSDFVYLNQGDGTFVESGEAMGVALANAKGLAISVVDFDEDGHPEIYVANDMAPNFLFTLRKETEDGETPDGANDGGANDGGANDGGANDGETNESESKGLYKNVAVSSGCALSGEGNSEASMGIACGDFDQDGRIDIFLTHFYSQKNTLYHNSGGLIFHDDSRRSRIAATSFQTLGFGTVAFDYDRNGSLDLFVANGHVQGPLHEPYKMAPQLLYNDGTGRFDDVSGLSGEYFTQLWLGRSAAGVDFDNDGDVDLSVAHAGGPFALLRNDTKTPHSYIGINLQTTNRAPATGGKVIVRRGKDVWQKSIVIGGSYQASGDSRLLFGVGESLEPVEVEVHWGTGNVQNVQRLELDVNRYWTIHEGGDARDHTL